MNELFEIIRGLCAAADGIREADRDNGQLDEEQPQVYFPCALIKISMPYIQTITPTVQQCRGTVQITVAHDLMKMETTSLAPQEASERSLQYMGYANAVFRQLQGYETDPIFYMDRISSTDGNRNGRQTVTMVFNCGFLDRSAEG